MVGRWWEWLNAEALRRDRIIAAAWFALGLVVLAAGGFRLWSDLALAQAGRGVFAVLLACAAVLATLRSRRPFLALALGLVVAAVDLSLGGSLGVVLVLTDLAYAALRYGSDRGVWITFRAGLAAAALVAIVLVLVRPEDPMILIAAAQWSLILIVSGTWGWNVRSAQERTRAAMQTQHSRVTEELRRRIAHDLHDLVANQIAVAGLHIEAAKLQADRAPADPAPLTRSLEQAKCGTDQAHGELRTLIDVLTAVDPLEHTVSVASDDGLVVEGQLARLLPAGRELRWPAGAAAELDQRLAGHDDSSRHVLLRVLRELVANAAKHGTGDVLLDVAASPGAEVVITLTNECGPAGGGMAAGSGLGLAGARLLLRGIGGDLASGRVGAAEPSGPAEAANPAGQWRATITLPAANAPTTHPAHTARPDPGSPSPPAATDRGGRR